MSINKFIVILLFCLLKIVFSLEPCGLFSDLSLLSSPLQSSTGDFDHSYSPSCSFRSEAQTKLYYYDIPDGNTFSFLLESESIISVELRHNSQCDDTPGTFPISCSSSSSIYGSYSNGLGSDERVYLIIQTLYNETAFFNLEYNITTTSCFHTWIDLNQVNGPISPQITYSPDLTALFLCWERPVCACSTFDHYDINWVKGGSGAICGGLTETDTCCKIDVTIEPYTAYQFSLQEFCSSSPHSNIIYTDTLYFNSSHNWYWIDGSDSIDPIASYPDEYFLSGYPSARYGGASWSTDTDFYLFGGFGFDHFHNETIMNDLWRYDIAGNTWFWINGCREISVTSNHTHNFYPPPLFFPSTFKSGSTLYLFGGYGLYSLLNVSSSQYVSFSGFYNTLWSYNTGTEIWTIVNGELSIDTETNFPLDYGDEGTIGGRSHTTGGLYNNHIYIYGGKGFLNITKKPSIDSMCDLWDYNTIDQTWTWLSGSNEGDKSPSYPSEYQEIGYPGSRIGAMSFIISEGFYLYGGEDSFSRVYSDLWFFDLESTDYWLWIGGCSGVNNIQIKPNSPSSIYTKDTVYPGSRSFSNSYYDSIYEEWYVFGGYSLDCPGECQVIQTSDLWKYDIQENLWFHIFENGNGDYQSYEFIGIPSSRSSATLFSNDNTLYIFGGEGFNKVGVYNDFWKYQLVTSDISKALTVTISPFYSSTQITLPFLFHIYFSYPVANFDETKVEMSGTGCGGCSMESFTALANNQDFYYNVTNILNFQSVTLHVNPNLVFAQYDIRRINMDSSYSSTTSTISYDGQSRSLLLYESALNNNIYFEWIMPEVSVCNSFDYWDIRVIKGKFDRVRDCGASKISTTWFYISTRSVSTVCRATGVVENEMQITIQEKCDNNNYDSTLVYSNIVYRTPTLTFVTVHSDNPFNTEKAAIGDKIYIIFKSTEKLDLGSIECYIATKLAVTSETGEEPFQYISEYTLQENDFNGVLTFSIYFSDIYDKSGSTVSSTTDGSSVLIDTSRPILTMVMIYTDHSGDSSKGGISDTISLIFQSNENLISLPNVTFGEYNGSLSVTGPKQYKSTFFLTEDSFNGVIPFTISFVDSNGNEGNLRTTTTDASSVTCDTIRPIINSCTISSTQITGEYASIDDTISLLFSTDTELYTDPEVSICDRTASVFPTINPNEYIAEYTLSDDDCNGEIFFEINSIDLYLNPSITATTLTSGDPIFADTQRPTVSYCNIKSDHIDETRVGINGKIIIEFVLSEPTPILPIVTIIGNSPVLEQTSLLNFTAFYILSNNEFNGLITFSISFMDYSNNTAISVTSTTDGSQLNADTIAPILTLCSIESNNLDTTIAAIGDFVTVTFISNEPLSNNLQVIFINTTVIPTNIGNPSEWTAVYELKEKDVQGNVPFTINYEDLFGNIGVPVSAITTGSNVLADTLYPSLLSCSISSDFSSNSSRAHKNDVITIDFETSEPLSNPPVSLILSRVATISGSNPYTASITINGDDDCGYATFYIIVSDMVGNDQVFTTVQDNSFVMIDTISPTPVNCPSSVTISTDKFQNTGKYFWPLVNFTDNFDINPEIEIKSGPTLGLSSGSSFPLGTTQIKYFSTDLWGNTDDSCSFAIVVQDTEPPRYQDCPSNIIEITDLGESEAVVTWQTPSAIDNSGLSADFFFESYPTVDLESGDLFPLGVTTISYTFYDFFGNQNTSCWFRIGVLDSTEMDFSCPDNLYEISPVFNNSHYVWWEQILAVNTVDYSFFEPILSSDTSNACRGCFFEIGVHNITYSYPQNFNNSYTCSFGITISCPTGTSYNGELCVPCGSNQYNDIETWYISDCPDCPIHKVSLPSSENCFWPPFVAHSQTYFTEDTPNILTLIAEPGEPIRPNIFITILSLPVYGHFYLLNSTGGYDAANPILFTPFSMPINTHSLYYIPPANFHSPPNVFLIYQASDGLFQSNISAWATITISSVNDPPMLANMKHTTNGLNDITILNLRSISFDVDMQEDILQYELLSLPQRGAVVNPNTYEEITEVPYFLVGQRLFYNPNTNNELGIMKEYATMNIRVHDLESHSEEATISIEIVCDLPYYINVWTSGSVCLLCPEGALCASDGSFTPIANEGFWEAGLGVFLSCDPIEACPIGASSNECNKGYEGRRCGQCSKSYYRLSGKCTPCPTDSNLYLYIFGGLTVMILLAIMFWVSTKGPSLGFISITFTYLQSLAIVSKIRLQWPSEVESIFSGLSAFNMNVELLSIECDVPKFSWAAKYIGFISLPFGILFLMIILWVLVVVILHLSQAIGFAVDAFQKSVLYSYLFIKTYVLILVFLYISVSSTVIELFDCTALTDGHYLDADPQTKCYDTLWFTLLPYGILGIIIYCIGIPVVFMFILASKPEDEYSYNWICNLKCPRFIMARLDEEFQQKNINIKTLTMRKSGTQQFYLLEFEREMDSLNWLSKYGSLSVNFNQRCFYWEIVVMIRKLFISFTKMFVTQFPMFQATLVCFILLVSLLLQTWYQAFRHVYLNHMEFASLISSIFILLGGLLCYGEKQLLSNEWYRKTASNVMITIFSLSVAYLAFQLIKVGYKNIKDYFSVKEHNKEAKKIHRLTASSIPDLTDLEEEFDILDNVYEKPLEQNTLETFNTYTPPPDGDNANNRKSVEMAPITIDFIQTESKEKEMKEDNINLSSLQSENSDDVTLKMPIDEVPANIYTVHPIPEEPKQQSAINLENDIITHQVEPAETKEPTIEINTLDSLSNSLDQIETKIEPAESKESTIESDNLTTLHDEQKIEDNIKNPNQIEPTAVEFTSPFKIETKQQLPFSLPPLEDFSTIKTNTEPDFQESKTPIHETQSVISQSDIDTKIDEDKSPTKIEEPQSASSQIDPEDNVYDEHILDMNELTRKISNNYLENVSLPGSPDEIYQDI